ncbi:MAG: tetratricopeptide repeat protein [Planctomycetota bacterium]|jgi:tetratricopeptide (TPR) repeat protein
MESIAPTILRSARVAFTGKLASMSRRNAASMLRERGGVVTSTVSRRTSILVVGMDGWPLLANGAVSAKLRRAERLRADGSPIRIVSEREFLEMLGVEPRERVLRKSFPARRISALLGVEPATLRRWELLGLVRSDDGQYDFQDIVSLRTIAELVANGVGPETIGRNVRALASVLPGTERPLAQLKIVVEDQGRLLAEIGETLVDPVGQLLLNFDASGSADPERPGHLERADDTLRFAGAGLDPDTPTDSAEGWFAHGQSLEEQERYEEAREAYGRALAIDPGMAEAHFNLGNVLRALGRLEAAEERYRMAVAEDCMLVEAWYNLADVQEETGRVADAVTSLQRALRSCPSFADAHYNLAMCCEQLGRRDEAHRHWSMYIDLDPTSEWADEARRRLTRLESMERA